MTLYFPRHFTCLERRDSCKSICRCYLHYFYVGTNAPYFATLAVWAPCFLKVRVGENSPSLCPTMFSVTNTELKIFPLWTRKVCPTKSGVIMERRDQVLIGLRAPVVPVIFSTFSRSLASTNGPFFNDLDIDYFVFFLLCRRSTMTESLGLCLRRVLNPLANWPHGLTG